MPINVSEARKLFEELGLGSMALQFYHLRAI